MSNWNKIFKPIVVLCVICIAITGSLAATNKVTAPIIEAARIEAERLARIELLPEAALQWKSRWSILATVVGFALGVLLIFGHGHH